MRKDIKALNEAYEQATKPRTPNYTQPDYNIIGKSISVYDIPTYAKADSENARDVDYVFQFQRDDLTDDLVDRNFKMYDHDVEVDPNDYEEDDIYNAATEAIKILMHHGEVERTY
jgi:hypothetical protein